MDLEKRMRGSLLAWFNKYARVLPWRQEPSLYKTVVSEFMLQQTQVQTVLPYFERWLKLFPDFSVLANVEESAVIKAWAGLGYYSRAKRLQQLAKICCHHQPKNYTEWLQCPGIGPYTAAAISSIAQNEPIPVIDGNVIRVLSRFIAEKTIFKDKTEAFKRLQPFAEKFLDRDHPGKYNEAIMELGALICTKSHPLCHQCPIRNCCRMSSPAEAELYPQWVPQAYKTEEIPRLWLCDGKNFLVEKSDFVHRSSRMGLYEIPCLNEARKAFFNEFEKLLEGKRSIGKRRITEMFFTPTSPQPLNALLREKPFQQCQSIPVENFQQYAYTGPHQRWITQLLKSVKSL